MLLSFFSRNFWVALNQLSVQMLRMGTLRRLYPMQEFVINYYFHQIFPTLFFLCIHRYKPTVFTDWFFFFQRYEILAFRTLAHQRSQKFIFKTYGETLRRDGSCSSGQQPEYDLCRERLLGSETGSWAP